jgi:hypothetical protein
LSRGWIHWPGFSPPAGPPWAVQPRAGQGNEWARIQARIRELLRAAPRQRVLSLPRKAGTRFRPLELIRTLAGRRVRFVLVDEIAARSQGARNGADPGSRKGLPTSLRDLRGRGQIRTRFGTIGLWWPADEAYRRLERAASEIALARRPVLVASIDDVIDRWARRGDELELLALVREETDARAVLARHRRARA